MSLCVTPWPFLFLTMFLLPFFLSFHFSPEIYEPSCISSWNFNNKPSQILFQVAKKKKNFNQKWKQNQLSCKLLSRLLLSFVGLSSAILIRDKTNVTFYWSLFWLQNRVSSLYVWQSIQMGLFCYCLKSTTVTLSWFQQHWCHRLSITGALIQPAPLFVRKGLYRPLLVSHITSSHTDELLCDWW